MTARLTILATTDLHGQVRDFDYGTDSPYEDAYGNRIGLARVASVVRQVRASAPYALLVDAGDVLEGSALAHHFSRRLSEPTPPLHPMAAAMNHLGYDAVTLGNHELDYGVRALAAFRDQLDAPLLGGNVRDAVTGEPAFAGSVVRDVPVAEGVSVRVGIVGLTTPSVTAWNRDVAAELRFDDLVAAAGPLVAAVRGDGAEVVVAVVHAGIVEPPTRENAALDLARLVPGIDVVVAGHAHIEVDEHVERGPDGRPVLLTEPLCWGMRVALVELDLVADGGRWRVGTSRSRLIDTATAPEDPAVVALVAPQHARVRALGAEVVGHAPGPIDPEPSRYRATDALALVALAQAEGARAVSGSTAPLVSLVSPASRCAPLAAGPVRRRDVAALCPFDSGVVVVQMDGRALRRHLEHAATFFRAAAGPGPYDPDALTNAPTSRTPLGTPDFDHDIAYGVDAPLTYEIDLARPVGRRVTGLAYDGAPLADDHRLDVVVSRYRASGAASYPDVARVPVVAEVPGSLRNLVESHLAAGRPYASTPPHWRLVHDGVPIVLVPPG
ncbi:bifunctional metallophosphatase/5'-nucleotidase [Mumia zhuanghuii]|uniref:Bifunctional metallophosphatase/5'-nucleotidase n=2 Tax=Mumia TaxID=1546255 RepID=A0A5Q6S224_9ACTN|nr:MULTISPECIES: bifunctional metallophosphatase/5'-nucleotidase [Mumia]KAA1418032.1 bifunctional metallophosphatase/5'-nucleotidase [Mumia zhuanghuii]KAA1424413.1 bifunctional metallophosphatase/5'-nucleotidase [Mumia zhuanghuii]